MPTSTLTFRQWLLRERPTGNIDVSKTFEITNDATITYDPEDMQGKVLVRVRYLSNDPAQRTFISGGIPEDRHYVKPIQSGEVMLAFGVAEVIDSGDLNYLKGDSVYGIFGWSEYALVDSSTIMDKVEEDPVDFMALGGTARSAYFGLFHVASATQSDKTIVVSAAAGATGSLAVQIAKRILNCPRVIGIAGGPEKCALVKEQCGADIVLDYKSANFAQDLEMATPDFVDVYFDGVGGKVTDAVVSRIAKGGRVAVCGSISGYDNENGVTLSNKAYFTIISMRARLQGFFVFDFTSQFPAATAELTRWTTEGKITPLKTVWEAGFKEVPEGMAMLFKGVNNGKLVTKLAD